MDSIRERIKLNTNPKPVAFELADVGTVYIRRMTLEQMYAHFDDQNKMSTDKKILDQSVNTLLYAIVDENGVAVFDENSEEDKKLLASLPPSTAQKVGNKFREVNALNNTTAEEVEKKD